MGEQLYDPCDGSLSSFLNRSVLGLIRVYNLLPQRIVNARSVKIFQRGLQKLVLSELDTDNALWDKCLSTVAGGIFWTVRRVQARPGVIAQ